MKESKFILEILEEERHRNFLEAKRVDILRVLRARFRVEPPTEIAATLATLDQIEQLENWLDQAATCSRLEKFRAALLAQHTA